jgi:hypothetical protein
MMNGLTVLSDLKESSGMTSQNFYYNGVKIKRSSLEHGLAFYRMGIDRYLGNILVRRLVEHGFVNLEQLRGVLEVKAAKGKGRWLDLAGLITAEDAIGELLGDIEGEAVSSLEEVNVRICEMYNSFADYEWAWVANALERKLDKPVEQFTPEDIEGVIGDWIGCVEKLDEMRLSDARKEFGPASKIGFGIDGDEQARDEDFRAVRGTPEDEAFTTEIKKRLDQKKQTAQQLIAKLHALM